MNTGSLASVINIDENAIFSPYERVLLEEVDEAVKKEADEKVAKEITDDTEKLYDQIKYKGMNAGRAWLAKMLKWCNQKAYEFNRKVRLAGKDAPWWKRALSIITNCIEYLSRRLHNFVSDKQNQILGKSEQELENDKSLKDHMYWQSDYNHQMKKASEAIKEVIDKNRNDNTIRKPLTPEEIEKKKAKMTPEERKKYEELERALKGVEALSK